MTIVRASRFIRLSAGLCALILATQAHAQQPALGSDTLRGRVTADSGRAKSGVMVIVTMAPDRTVQQAVTDTSGRYEIHFASGTGDYLVYAAPPGYRAFRRRVTRALPSHVIVVDIALASDVAVLAPVRTTATRPRALPDGGFAHDPTGAEANPSGLIGLLSADQLGNLSALAATIPGITLATDGSLVAFGLPGQVTTTFNGMSFAGASIPPDTRAQVRVTTSAYDPSVGGFGGARVNVEMGQGGRVSEVFGRVMFDGRPLQYTDRVSSALGQQITRVQLSGNANGPFGGHDAWYNGSVQATRQTVDALSLLAAQPDILALAGISQTSASRVQQAATSLGIPLTRAGIPASTVNQSLSFMGRVDHYADPQRYGKLWTNALTLTTFAALDQSDAPGSGPATAPGFGQQTRRATGQMIGQFIHLADTYAAELTNSFSAAHRSSDNYLTLPAARVLVASELAPGEFVTSGIALGGNPNVVGTSGVQSWESVGTLTFYLGTQHKMKLYGRSLFDVASTSPAQSLGAFSYASLADFESNRPASFDRVLTSPSQSTAAWRGAMSVGDLWQVTPGLQVQTGVRLEANHFLSALPDNAGVNAAFGLSNTTAPNTVHASPRLGFAWMYAPSLALGSDPSTGSAGTGRITLPVRGTLIGGIGEFRNDMGAASLLNALSSSGLPGAATRVSCYGGAVPVADWHAYDSDPLSIPTQCANGAAPAFSDASPNVDLFDPSYQLARSWRANLQWGSTYRKLRYSINAAYSYNIDQPGQVDLNFRNTPQFSLRNERNRPVYVLPSAIITPTGLVSPAGARRTALFGRVLDRVSDLRSTARQATLTLVPTMDNALLSIAYTLSDVQATTRGFGGTTFGSPVDLEEGRSSFDVRHSIMIQTGYRLTAQISASLYWSVRSVSPYSPMVGSDINGDGIANDRAFIFDPSQTSDTALAAGVRRVLSSAPSQARACLARQVGKPAALNSCDGPWTSAMNAALTSNFFHVLDGRLAVISLNVSNPLGGLDQLLHGGDALRGWGVPAYPDATLLTVRTFDPTTREFSYSVNPRFGSTRSSQSTLRAPIRVTMSGRLELGTPVQQQDFKRFLQMSAVRQNFAPAPLDSLRSRLSDLPLNPYATLLARRDSLLLSRGQVDSITALGLRYRTRADAVWQDLALFILSRPDSPDLKEIVRRKDDAASRVWALQREDLPYIMAILAPAQRELVESMLASVINSRDRRPPMRYIF